MSSNARRKASPFGHKLWNKYQKEFNVTRISAKKFGIVRPQIRLGPLKEVKIHFNPLYLNRGTTHARTFWHNLAQEKTKSTNEQCIVKPVFNYEFEPARVELTFINDRVEVLEVEPSYPVEILAMQVYDKIETTRLQDNLINEVAENSEQHIVEREARAKMDEWRTTPEPNELLGFKYDPPAQ